MALAENVFNLLRVDDLLFTRLDHPARMHLADLNVNVNRLFAVEGVEVVGASLPG